VMRQITYMAKQLWEHGAKRLVDEQELVDVAIMALIKARRRFDPAKGAWSTFAAPRAFGAMKDALRELDHVPRLERARAKKDGRVLKELLSIDRSPHDLVPRDMPAEGLGPHDGAAASDEWARLRLVLPERQAELVERYFRRDQTLREIGREIGISESRACQLLEKSLRRLRLKLRKEAT